MISSISAVPKKNSVKLRVVIDMSASGLNGCLLPPRFMLPTVEEVAQEAYPGCWFVVTDLSNGFYCQRLHDGSLAYLGVRNPADGKLYAYRRLPMGLGVSPHNFSRKVAVAVCEAMKNLEEFKVHEWRVNDSCPFMPRVYPVDEKGMPVASLKYYVDDGIITAASKEAAEKAYKKLAWFLEARLGLRLNHKKKVGPAQRVPFLGLELDSVGRDVGGACIRLPPERRQRCRDIVEEFMRTHAGRDLVHRRDLASLTGELMFASRAVPAGRTFCARMYRCQSEADSEVRGVAHDYDRKVPLTKGAWKDLKWWKLCLASCAGSRLWRTRSFGLRRLWTDASGSGYCDTMEVEARGELPAMEFGYGLWGGGQDRFSSNWHELSTIVMSLAEKGAELRGAKIHYITDNTTAAAAVNNGSVRSAQLLGLVRELRLLQAKFDVDLEAFHLSGKLIVAQGTDGGSRQLPYLGQLGPNPVSHDWFDPFAWPAFELAGEALEMARKYKEVEGVIDCSGSETWAEVDPAGKDTYWHVAPRHAPIVMGWLLDAQLRQPATTAFTVVVALAGVRGWRRAAKHFRSRERVRLQVQGLGNVWHMVLRYEKGDGLLGKPKRVESESEGGHTSTLHPPPRPGARNKEELAGSDDGWEDEFEFDFDEHAGDWSAAWDGPDQLDDGDGAGVGVCGVSAPGDGHRVSGLSGVRRAVPLAVLPSDRPHLQTRGQCAGGTQGRLQEAGLRVRGLQLSGLHGQGTGDGHGLGTLRAGPDGHHRRVPPGRREQQPVGDAAPAAGRDLGKEVGCPDNVGQVDGRIEGHAEGPPAVRMDDRRQGEVGEVRDGEAFEGLGLQLLPPHPRHEGGGHPDIHPDVHAPDGRFGAAAGCDVGAEAHVHGRVAEAAGAGFGDGLCEGAG